MNNKFDIEEPTIGHFNRFQAKLAKQAAPPKKKVNWYKYVAVAASLLLLFTFSLGNENSSKGTELAAISPKMEETQDYFNTVIHKELEKIAKVKNSDNEKIINDAFAQLHFLENDYKKQTIALASNTENKSIIYAMINNYQQRIEVLKNVLNELNKFNHIKNNYNETNNL